MKLFKYFAGEIELASTFPRPRAEVRERFPQGTIKRFDSFDLLVGTEDGRYSATDYRPVTRIICYEIDGTKHKCDSRCRNAKRDDCECSCGGKNHGIDRVF